MRPVDPGEGDRLLPLMGELADQFPDAAVFAAWQANLVAMIGDGRLRALAAWEAEAPVAVLLYQGDGLVTVLAGLGRVDDGFLQGAIAHLQTHAQALIWNEACGTDWPDRLAGQGARPYVLQTFVQDMRRVQFRELPPIDLEIRPWQAQDADAVVATLAAANAGTLAGVFLTMPEAPSYEAIATFLRRLVNGESGRFLPQASPVAVRDGRILGVLLCIEKDGRAFLFELAVHPDARGRQLSRRLVIAMQRALMAEGRIELGFITTESNTPVHRLFERHEIVHYEESRGGYWLRSAGPG